MKKIVVDQNVHFGKPVILGTRICVQDVLELLEAGLSFEQIRQEYYPDLTDDDIRECISYAIALIQSERIVISQP